ncbi:MAG: DUF4177 domain-containing protein [Luteimonas sp.]
MSQRWSYKVVEVPVKLFAGQLGNRVQQELDKLGPQGWELVGGTGQPGRYAAPVPEKGDLTWTPSPMRVVSPGSRTASSH